MRIIITLLLLIPIAGISQKISSVEIDKFTNQKRVLTEKLYVIGGFRRPNLQISFRSVDSTCFINLHGEHLAAGVIGPTDEAWLLFEDNSKIVVQSTGLQSYDFTPTSHTKIYNHQYSISRESILKLSKQQVVSIRRYYNSNYSDIEIWNKVQKNKKEIEKGEERSFKLMTLAKLFYDEVNK